MLQYSQLIQDQRSQDVQRLKRLLWVCFGGSAIAHSLAIGAGLVTRSPHLPQVHADEPLELVILEDVAPAAVDPLDSTPDPVNANSPLEASSLEADVNFTPDFPTEVADESTLAEVVGDQTPEWFPDRDDAPIEDSVTENWEGEDSMADKTVAEDSVTEDSVTESSSEMAAKPLEEGEMEAVEAESGPSEPRETEVLTGESSSEAELDVAESGDSQDGDSSGGTSANAAPITPGHLATRLFNSGGESSQESSAGNDETGDRPQALRSPVAPSRQGRPSTPSALSTSETGTGTGGGLACAEGCEGTYEASDSERVERDPLIRARRNERGEYDYELVESSGSDAADRAALETARQSRFEGDRDEFMIRAQVARDEEEARRSRERVERQRERARQAAEPTPSPESQETVVQEWDNPPSSTVNSDWEEEVTPEPLAEPPLEENVPQPEATPTPEPVYQEAKEPVYQEPVYQEPMQKK